jgi:hypothetical protein
MASTVRISTVGGCRAQELSKSLSTTPQSSSRYTAEQNGYKVGEDFWGKIGKSVETAVENLVGVNNPEFKDDL